MADRTLNVRVTADTRAYERAFGRTSQTAKVFGTNVERAGVQADRSVKAFRSLGSVFAGGLVASTAVAGLRSVVSAAAEAENVLGQTKVALEAAGKSWDAYGKQIQDAVADQSRLGFDDEELLRTFSTFVRRTGDVNKALKLNALAADVARGRYISLAQASQIVLKASLGQAGALRRIGIDARRGASGVELLSQLTQQYGGSARRAGGDATVAMERLKVSLENLQETAGAAALPIVADFADSLSNAADKASLLVDKLKLIGDIKVPEIKIPVVGDIPGTNIAKAAKEFVLQVSPLGGVRRSQLLFNAFAGGETQGTPQLSGPGGPGGLTTRTFSPLVNLPDKTTQAITELSTRLRIALADAQATPGTSDDLLELGKQKTFLEQALKDTRGLKPKQILALKQELNGVLGAIDSINDSIASAAKEQKEALQRSAKELARKRAEEREKANRLAEDIKRATKDVGDARVQRLDLVQNARDAFRAVRDARENLQKQLRIGGVFGIREAREELQDAKLARRRLRLQGVTFRGDTAPGSTTSIGSIRVEINSNQDPVKIAQQVLAQLRKKANQTSPQTRGRRPGVFYGGS